MKKITLPLHIKFESELFGSQYAQYQKGLKKDSPNFEKEKQKAALKYIQDFIKHTQIGR